ncbi:hypothetical protein EDC04DRAFT_2597199 [Pisolithus marmoratus]|nr:hypothetical protein EDC04DRAFT_2597199 [Pisolithus marmoratus]
MLQRRGVGVTVCRSNPRLQSGIPCRPTSVLLFSDLASVTKGANPARPKTSLGNLLTRSSDRPAVPPKRPVQRRLDNGRQRSNATHPPHLSQLDQNTNDRKGIKLRQIPSQGAPPHMRDQDKGGGRGQSPQLESEEEHSREVVKAPLENEDTNLFRTNLAELFAPRIYSAQRTRGRGGDYSGYLPPAITRSPGSLGPVDRALLALGRNKDVPYESRREALEIISQSVSSRVRKA